MKNLILILTLLAASPALAGHWVKLENGKLPKPQGAVMWSSEALCGTGCVSIDKPGGGIYELDVSSIVGTQVVEDADKRVAKEAAEAADLAQRKAAKDARKAVLKSLSKVKDEDVRAVLQAIIDELKLAE